MRDGTLTARLRDLETHLERENPILLKVVRRFRELDRVGYQLGVLEPDESYALQIPWWPLIAVLGTYSAGKSTFINDLIGAPLQKTGNQAVDDKFTVICYSRDADGHILPGLALDADVRFPFYRVSDEIERVAAGEGRRVDAYLQLKTSSAETLRGKILIDSPGFDADSQRTSTLRITRHIIDLSDLVLVFFDARHPEPGAMQDTLDHLVGETIQRPDSNKFLFILNQIDTAARDDNTEEVVAAWQRALAQKGLTAGRFFTIYNETVAVPIENEYARSRFQKKRDADLDEIKSRIAQVKVERAYRIVGALELTADRLEHELVPALLRLNKTWMKRVAWTDTAVLFVALVLVVSLALAGGFGSDANWLSQLASQDRLLTAFAFAGIVGAGLCVHFFVRRLIARRMSTSLQNGGDYVLLGAFRRNARFWRSIFISRPSGWTRRNRNLVAGVRQAASGYVQTLNDLYADPSGYLPDASATAPTTVQRERDDVVAIDTTGSR